MEEKVKLSYKINYHKVIKTHSDDGNVYKQSRVVELIYNYVSVFHSNAI